MWVWHLNLFSRTRINTSGKFCRWQLAFVFIIFLKKIGFNRTFVSHLLWKVRKFISKCHLLTFIPSMSSACLPIAFVRFHFAVIGYLPTLTVVLLNPDMPCICKQCRSRSVGFWRSQLYLDLHCLSLSMYICIKLLDPVIWLAEN